MKFIEPFRRAAGQQTHIAAGEVTYPTGQSKTERLFLRVVTEPHTLDEPGNPVSAAYFHYQAFWWP